MNWHELRIAIVGPLPPPAGGMATQTQQLADLLRSEGAQVLVVQTNARCRPRWIAGVRAVRAVPRLIQYLARLWQVAGKVQIFHVMANSGWSWHLFATPAIWIGRLRGVGVVVNYHGGEASVFLERSALWVRPSLRAASALAVPSGFLEQVFSTFGFSSSVVPNIVDLSRFHPVERGTKFTDGDCERADRMLTSEVPFSRLSVLISRNLELIYDIASALRAFALVRKEVPSAKLIVAGSGPENEALRALASELGIADAVEFTGRLDRQQMAVRYREATVMLNPSRVDNMPVSVLEALASGVPVVSTNVGGVPYVVVDERTALLVSAGDSNEMANALLRLHRDRELSRRLVAAGLAEVERYTWPRVRKTLGELYKHVLDSPMRGTLAS